MIATHRARVAPLLLLATVASLGGCTVRDDVDDRGDTARASAAPAAHPNVAPATPSLPPVVAAPDTAMPAVGRPSPPTKPPGGYRYIDSAAVRESLRNVKPRPPR